MDDAETRLITGLVKWFDPNKGYGFILNAEGGSDVLLHGNVLRKFGRSSVADQSRIVARAQPTARGLQACEILSISPPEGDGTPPIADLDRDVIEHLDQLPLRPARVKWFDKGKGFGFANIFGYPDDVFIHIEVLRHSGFSDLSLGEAICVRVVEGPRGLMAAQVAGWDDAITPICGQQGEATAPDRPDGGTAEMIQLLRHVAQ